MNLIFFTLCTIFFVFVSVSYSTIAPELAGIKEENILSALTNSKLEEDECINNSIESYCKIDQQHARTSQRGATLNSKPQVDTQEELSLRIAELDKLGKSTDTDYEADFLANIKQYKYDDQKTLKQVLILHRHGDRCPIQFQMRDPLKDEPFWTFHGLGQLTNRGKSRLFILGKLIRQRYDNFMNNSVSKLERLSRSSGSLRCMESAQTFLAGFLNLNQVKSSDAERLIWDLNNNNPLAHLWQPASVYSVPSKIDGMLAEGAQCDALSEEFETTIEQLPEIQALYRDYKQEADVMFDILGHKMDHFYKWFWGSSQIEVEKEYFESKMDKRILDIYDRLNDAGNIALGSLQATLKAKRLRAGLLIYDIIHNMIDYEKLHSTDQRYYEHTTAKKFVHYSAHDITIIVLLGMLEQWEKYPFRPDYASSLIFELHLDYREWFVKMFYMPKVPMEPIELHMNRCEEAHPKGRCTLKKLKELMNLYMINNWQNWMKECKNTSPINPYLQSH